MSLFFDSINADAIETVVLLHGLFSSHEEYADVVPHLSAYHLLVPDLPAHGKSSSIPIDSFDGIVTAIYELITTHAHGQSAHIVGLSFGGYLSLTLAAKHPEVVRSCWVTGCCQVLSGTLAALGPYVVISIAQPLRIFPGILRWMLERQGIKVSPEFIEGFVKNVTLTTCQNAYRGISKEYKLQPVAARTLAIAGSKEDPVNLLPGQVEVLMKGNSQSRGAVVRDGMHAWDLQLPELFAAGVQAWIEENELPEGLVDLDTWLDAERAKKKKGLFW